MTSAIEQAIQEKKLVEFIYSGKQRIVEPHILGVKGGVTQLLGYQIAGSSSSGGLPEWRRFDVLKMSGFSTKTDTFSGPRKIPTGKHSSWDREIAVVR